MEKLYEILETIRAAIGNCEITAATGTREEISIRVHWLDGSDSNIEETFSHHEIFMDHDSQVLIDNYVIHAKRARENHDKLRDNIMSHYSKGM